MPMSIYQEYIAKFDPPGYRAELPQEREARIHALEALTEADYEKTTEARKRFSVRYAEHRRWWVIGEAGYDPEDPEDPFDPVGTRRFEARMLAETLHNHGS